MMERGIQIKGAEDPDPRAFDTDAVLVSQEEIEEQFAQVIALNPPILSLSSLSLFSFTVLSSPLGTQCFPSTA